MAIAMFFATVGVSTSVFINNTAKSCSALSSAPKGMIKLRRVLIESIALFIFGGKDSFLKMRKNASPKDRNKPDTHNRIIEGTAIIIRDGTSKDIRLVMPPKYIISQTIANNTT